MNKEKNEKCHAWGQADRQTDRHTCEYRARILWTEFAIWLRSSFWCINSMQFSMFVWCHRKRRCGGFLSWGLLETPRNRGLGAAKLTYTGKWKIEKCTCEHSPTTSPLNLQKCLLFYCVFTKENLLLWSNKKKGWNKRSGF